MHFQIRDKKMAKNKVDLTFNFEPEQNCPQFKTIKKKFLFDIPKEFKVCTILMQS